MIKNYKLILYYIILYYISFVAATTIIMNKRLPILRKQLRDEGIKFYINIIIKELNII